MSNDIIKDDYFFESKRDSLRKLFEFITLLENDLFKYDKVKDMSIEDKFEFYKNAKGALQMYINYYKDINSIFNNSEDELLKSIIVSLNSEQKKLLKKALLDIIKGDKNGNNKERV